MKTNDLIAALAADLPTKPTPVWRAITMAIAVSVPVLLTILLGFVKIRPGIESMLLDMKILPKFVFTIGLFLSALWLGLRVTRPGPGAGPARFALLAVFALLGLAVVSELINRPMETWAAAMLGTYSVPCMVLILIFSIAPFTALMFAFRTGAPDSPAVAGAAAGLIAGSLGASFYATHCVEDSALFMAVWYVIGISAVTILGAIVGRYALKW